MAEHILFLTGKLAKNSLEKTLAEVAPDFTYTVHQIGLSVAALMTTDMIKRRLTDTFGAQRVVLPGRFRGDLDELSAHFKVPFERGPDELKDLPQFFGKAARTVDTSQYDINIFGEIVDAPERTVEDIVRLAGLYRESGADVIDLGTLPDTPFDHLCDAVNALKGEGFKVSVDTHDPDTLLKAARSGADYLMSLNESTLWVADETDATPIVIPTTPEDGASLYRCVDALLKKSKPFLADAILDPIHCGLSASLVRYHELRKRYPDIEIMFGIGNLSELTHADSVGVNTVLLGIASELNIRHILTTSVSEHCRRAIQELDTARRLLYWCREHDSPPTNIGNDLLGLHERHPFPNTEEEIREFADAVRDRNIRIQVSDKGIHVYNRDMYETVEDPFDIYPKLELDDDVGHAFYLGIEMARAHIAWQLGKRYEQDEPLSWGCAADKKEQDLTTQQAHGVTYKKNARKKTTKTIKKATKE